MKYLRPLILRDTHFAELEKAIRDIFYRAIYAPLFEVLKENDAKEVKNDTGTALAVAIDRGDVYQEEGRFYGRFSSKISKELKALGARYDARSRSWTFEHAVPAEVQISLARADAKTQKIINGLLSKIETIDLKAILAQPDLPGLFEKTAWRLNTEFVKSVESIAIPMKFTPAQSEAISREYAQNLELYIQKWTDQATLDLRQRILSNSQRGQRAGNLVKTIQDSYGVSKTKAKFLARQETALFMSKFQETRYKELGIRKYKWSGVDDARERPDHKLLNNKVFTWDNPPITNRDTGARNNPGEDYNCRCVAIPLLED